MEARSLAQNLTEQLDAQTYPCMICLAIIRRKSAIWTCTKCWAMFHLSCTEKWITSRRAPSLKKTFEWNCPVCDSPFTAPRMPPNSCFCANLGRPTSSPAATPHSCGGPCRRRRNCGHHCPLRCHPGPCPPCLVPLPPKACQCGKQTKRVICSSETAWVCGQICGKTLNCQSHHCGKKCHSGDCEECKRVVMGCRCFCGRETSAVRTCQPGGFFSCGEQCGRGLACGEHFCENLCHLGQCGECELRGMTRCPCGKKELSQIHQDCAEPIPVCGDQCAKVLPICGHLCTSLCHPRPCPPCKTSLQTTCRCGNTKRKVECGQLLSETTQTICNKICKKFRSCGKHKCNTKCCPASLDNGEHLCVMVCGKRLSCGVHTCDKFCHIGKCGGCEVFIQQDKFCGCGATVLRAPFRCNTPLPPCPHTCKKRLPFCDHFCPFPCHPGECAPCTELTDKQCGGGHTFLKDIRCCTRSSEVSCGAVCGKDIDGCTHKCIRRCHYPPCLVNRPCRQLCTVPRTTCEHACRSVCHGGGPCPDEPCQVPVDLYCGCKVRHESRACARAYKIDEGFGIKQQVALDCDQACAQAQRLAQLRAALLGEGEEKNGEEKNGEQKNGEEKHGEESVWAERRRSEDIILFHREPANGYFQACGDASFSKPLKKECSSMDFSIGLANTPLHVQTSDLPGGDTSVPGPAHAYLQSKESQIGHDRLEELQAKNCLPKNSDKNIEETDSCSERTPAGVQVSCPIEVDAPEILSFQ